MDILDDHQKDKMHEEILNKQGYGTKEDGDLIITDEAWERLTKVLKAHDSAIKTAELYECSLDIITEKVHQIGEVLDEVFTDDIIDKEKFLADVTRQKVIVNILSQITEPVFFLSVCHETFKKNWLEMANEWQQQGELTEPVWDPEKLFADANKVLSMGIQVADLDDRVSRGYPYLF